ncbi:hypothetical protein JB92DRAFT_2945077 [Gautieria morchelliformis]|nr:hypothetical protein JB92DRAFT_2945077 [Gautieria morchelliformis]
MPEHQAHSLSSSLRKRATSNERLSRRQPPLLRVPAHALAAYLTLPSLRSQQRRYVGGRFQP